MTKEDPDGQRGSEIELVREVDIHEGVRKVKEGKGGAISRDKASAIGRLAGAIPRCMKGDAVGIEVEVAG